MADARPPHPPHGIDLVCRGASFAALVLVFVPVVWPAAIPCALAGVAASAYILGHFRRSGPVWLCLALSLFALGLGIVRAAG